MDTLRVDYFEFEPTATLADIIKTWTKRGLWLHTVQEHTRTTYLIEDSSGSTVKQKNGAPSEFSTEALVEEYLKNNNLVNCKVISKDSNYYTIKNDKGNTVNNTDGTVKEFRKEEQALRTALYYNNDLVKIRQAAANYMVKGKKSVGK